ncbi:MAG: hypothetical protein HY744_07575 [Deltaproteobacteria bacterium]|nr:hypothetical protein [Deltaproteobacteria bacterium]
MYRPALCATLVASLIAAAASCGAGEDGFSSTSTDCPGCQSSGGAAGAGGGVGGGHGGNTGSGGNLLGGGPQGGGCPGAQCAEVCCEKGQFCALGTACAVEQAPCGNNDECWFDSYCEAGQCIPYGLPPEHDHDESCETKIDIEAIVPAVQCRWTGPPPGDPFPNHYHVMSTPMVVDFDLDNNPKTLDPSIVFTTFPTQGSYGNPGVLRVIRGVDCTHLFTVTDPADATMSPASVALGDIDGDKRAEIVAAAHGGGVLAFRYDPVEGKLVRMWRSGTCTPNGTTPDYTGGGDKWSGPSLHDLDDDGMPEVIYGATVYNAKGCIRSTKLGWQGYHKGYVPVVADVDEDGAMELVLGDGIYHWDKQAGDWQAEPYFDPAGKSAGQVAIAEMGSFPVPSLGGVDAVEIAVITSGTGRVQTLGGQVVFGPFAIPGGGSGGPPTIADFDGDGRRELASAGGSQYVVFDLDCVQGGNPAACGGQAKTGGVLWSQPSKDQSSNVTGSSVFDFDANGSAEAVYADECFLRVYEGATGTVLYSAARSSGTTYENPVIADVDGDYRTEILSAVNDYAGTLGCPGTDPLLPGTKFETNHGIVVLRDELDRWAASRPVWNQHAYSVTHVGDLGQLPKSSAVKLNWKDPALNNFRQNVQGDLDALGEPDLTAGGDVGAVQCAGTMATIEARVCNRGTLPMVGGTEVAFYENAPDGPELCSAVIPVALQVGECMVVSCQADLGGKVIDVFVKVDPDSLTKECHENNNAALYKGVGCGQIPH